jgi:hypothetical protein
VDSGLVQRVEELAVRLLPGGLRRPLRPLRRAVHRHRLRRETPASASAGKRRVITAHAKRFGTPVLVETGTFLGDTVQAMRREFRTIYSIELSTVLYDDARARFARAPNVNLLQGDSADVLPRLAREIAEPTLFWLDGHWSEGITALGDLESPLRPELAAVLARDNRGDVILIDDARCLTGEAGYPTVDEIRAAVRAADPRRRVEVAEDIVRIVPSG